MFMIDHNIGYSMWQLQHQMKLLLERRMSPLRLTLPQAATLMELHADPSMSSAEIARRLLLTPQALSLIISRLEGAGYLVRTPPVHGRSQALAVTPNGRAATRKADAIAKSVHQQVFGSLG